ncbi:hypothetical protein niasHS_002721 [Heterodera schachtii]|uniref:G-protein coupled receptors family 1 profile domain-containing protein n=1 Tax=Heterodera schachtii TaxID=97005 RepID=A0ABD2K294_HETSC
MAKNASSPFNVLSAPPSASSARRSAQCFVRVALPLHRVPSPLPMNAFPSVLRLPFVLFFSFFLIFFSPFSAPLPSSSSSSSAASLSVFSREDVALLYQRLKATGERTKKNGTTNRRTTAKVKTEAETEAKAKEEKGSGGRRRTTPAGTKTRHKWRNREQQQRNNAKMTTVVRAGASVPRQSLAPPSSSPVPSSTLSRVSSPFSSSSTSFLITSIPSSSVPSSADSIKRVKDQRIAFVAPPVSQKASASLTQILWVVLIILIGVFFTVATTIGNALVMLSICVDKKLQTISNYFLFSLAVADLTVGIVSIPLMTLYTVAQSWDFGYALCQFWLCIDYLMCNASALNLLLISFDRYFSVTRPLTYRPKRTTRKALSMIAGSYLLSLLLWPPWIVLWPYLEGRFIVEESAICVVQFLALGNSRNWLSQLVTVATAAAAFYIPVTMMIFLYYKVYLETKHRRKELRKLQDGQIRGLHSAPQLSSTDLSLPPPHKTSLGQSSPVTPSPTPIAAKSANLSKSGLNFLELVNNLSPTQSTFGRKKERFSLLTFCTGRAQTTDFSSEDSLADECGAVEETSCGGAMTNSNLDSIMAFSTPIEFAVNGCGEGAAKTERDTFVGADEWTTEDDAEKRGTTGKRNRNTLDLDRTSRPSSVHTYNSIVIIEYSDSPSGDQQKCQRPSVRLSSHEEVASISARNSVERRAQPKEKEEKAEEEEKEKQGAMSREQKSRLIKTKSCPAEGGRAKARGPTATVEQQTQQNGTTIGPKQLMKKSDILQLREEQMRRSEKERRRNERKQEGKAAKTLSAILFAFIITWTPYNVIVCLEAFYPNSVPSYLFTLSYFLSYVNSTINPLCYALCNARFRMTYLRIIKCKWRHSSIGRQLYAADGAFGQSNNGRKVLLKRHSRGRGAASSIQ